MPNAARLSGVGTFYTFEFDDNTKSSFSVSAGSTAFSNQFDENTSPSLIEGTDQNPSPVANVDIEFNFRYHAFGSDTNETTVYWYNETTSTLNTLTTISGEQQTSSTSQWDLYELDLSSYGGQTGRIVVRYSTGSDFNQDPALDEMELVGTTLGTIDLDPSNTQPNGGWEQQGGNSSTYPTTGYSALTSNLESSANYWQYDTNGTPSTNSGPDQDFNDNGVSQPAGYYIYFEGSSPNNQTGVYGWLRTSSTYTLASVVIPILANISKGNGSNVSSTTIDASSVTSNDLFVVTYQGEGSETPGDTFTCTINGTTATVATSNSNTSGRGRAGIFYVDGSVVAGDSTTSVSITESASGIRSSIQAFRLQNRSSDASIIVSDTDISETSNQSSQTNTVDFSNGVLFSTGHFPNGQGHSFTAGIETQYNGVQASGGSGDAGINETPTTSSHNVTYTKSGATNDEGEALATAVFSFGTDVHFWEDISGNNRDASFNGTTDPNDPAEGDFIDFDSSNNEYAVIDGDAVGSSSYNGVTGTSARTIIFGIKPDALATDSRPFSYGANSSGQRFTSRIMTTNKLRVEFGNGYTETTDAIVTTDWHVFAIVVPAGGSPTINDVRIWNNGIEQDLTTSSGGSTFNTASTNNVSIGAAQHESSPSYFNGQFAKAMIYSRELSDLEIKIIYQSILNRLSG